MLEQKLKKLFINQYFSKFNNNKTKKKFHTLKKKFTKKVIIKSKTNI